MSSLVAASPAMSRDKQVAEPPIQHNLDRTRNPQPKAKPRSESVGQPASGGPVGLASLARRRRIAHATTGPAIRRPMAPTPISDAEGRSWMATHNTRYKRRVLCIVSCPSGNRCWRIFSRPAFPVLDARHNARQNRETVYVNSHS